MKKKLTNALLTVGILILLLKPAMAQAANEDCRAVLTKMSSYDRIKLIDHLQKDLWDRFSRELPKDADLYKNEMQTTMKFISRSLPYHYYQISKY